jgi:hypothetical protein
LPTIDDEESETIAPPTPEQLIQQQLDDVVAASNPGMTQEEYDERLAAVQQREQEIGDLSAAELDAAVDETHDLVAGVLVAGQPCTTQAHPCDISRYCCWPPCQAFGF